MQHSEKLTSFDKTIVTFFKNLGKSFPEKEAWLKQGWDYYAHKDKSSYLREVLTTLHPHINHVNDYDRGIFSRDYSDGLFLLPKMDFQELHQILESPEMQTDQFKHTYDVIFKFIAKIYTVAGLALEELGQMDQNLRTHMHTIVNMIESKNTNVDDDVKQRLLELGQEDKLEQGQLTDMFAEITDKMDMDWVQELVGDLVKQSLPDDNSTPSFGDLLGNIMKNPEQLKSLSQKMGQKMGIDLPELDDEVFKNISDQMPMATRMGNEMLQHQIKHSYDQLSATEKTEWSCIPNIIERIADLSETEEGQLKEFMEQHTSEQPHIDMNHISSMISSMFDGMSQ